MLKASHLEKEYEGPRGKLHILRGVDLELNERDMVFIIGRSGAGKSTLLQLLGGLDKPTRGTVEFRGEDLSVFNEESLAEYRNKKVGFVFQFYHLLPEFTVRENVELPSLIRGKRSAKRSEELLKRVGLWARRDHLPGELSGGECQRTAIARSLINEPDLVLCDEPTGNLDDETAESVHQLIFELNQDGQTFCIVTHEENFAQRGNRILRLHEGVIHEVKKQARGVISYGNS
ncbi:MAG: ABC transporter ATP-binding protein [Candidatus Omnitrophica bacterium]|nr:ABC transporter ATP-binding protein [Candidatus Omnitrophota bacterium]